MYTIVLSSAVWMLIIIPCGDGSTLQPDGLQRVSRQSLRSNKPQLLSFNPWDPRLSRKHKDIYNQSHPYIFYNATIGATQIAQRANGMIGQKFLQGSHWNTFLDNSLPLGPPVFKSTSTDNVATNWILPKPSLEPRRNHDCVILNSSESLTILNILGRHGRGIEMFDVVTGNSVVASMPAYLRDPAGQKMNDLNHISAVPVKTLDSDDIEVWLPCGFHGDVTNHEISNKYVRIVSIDMKIRVGPRLPKAGGACSAMAIEVDGAGTPPHICVFGGTHGTHNTGTFLADVNCYDRLHAKWSKPFPDLPQGLDHGNMVMVPAGVCKPSDPPRLFLTNYRTQHYTSHSSQILSYDLPPSPNKPFQMFARTPEKPGLDAGGLVTSNGGRYLISVGGVHYNIINGGKGRQLVPDNTIQVFDTCNTDLGWKVISKLPSRMFAIQTCSAKELQLAVTCGGTGHENASGEGEKLLGSSNFRYCVASRLNNTFDLDSRNFVTMEL